MVTISKEKVANWQVLDLLAEKQHLETKLGFFQRKYDLSLSDFKNEVNSQEENFEKWDDLMEWEAFDKSLELIPCISCMF